MRKISTCILLFVFLLYQAGFYLFYLSRQHFIDSAMKDISVFNDNRNRLITKSIPITFPYQTDQDEYQPVMRVIEDNGKFYRVVMQRYAKDTLHIVYMADQDNQGLHSSLKDWVNTISQQSSHDKKTVTKDGLEKNYIPNKLIIVISNFSDLSTTVCYRYVPDILVNSLETLKPPPKS
jgi:hypothetical protein